MNKKDKKAPQQQKESKYLMSINLPSTFRNPYITLPIQLDIQGLVLLILIWHNGLFVGSLESIAIGIMPGAWFVGLVVGELALVVSAVGEYPSALGDWVVFPFADKFHTGLAVGVGAFALLLAEHPPATISVLIRIDICALAMLHAIFPLTYTITQKPYHSTRPYPYTSACQSRVCCCS